MAFFRLSPSAHLDACKVWRVVVVERVCGDAAVELLRVVESLRAQVVDEVVALVFLLQETLDLKR